MEVTSDITQIAQQLLDKYKQAVKDSGHNASGSLANSASCNVKFDGRYFEVIFRLQDYWKYLENGTNPHFPPTTAIERWITVKRIVPRSIDGKIPSTKQLAYLIARDISRNGTKGAKILEKTINSSDDIINNLVEVISNQLQEEINEEIENTVKQ